MYLKEALIYFPRCTQALHALAVALHAVAGSQDDLAVVETLLRKACTASLEKPGIPTTDADADADADANAGVHASAGAGTGASASALSTGDREDLLELLELDHALEKLAQREAKSRLCLLLCQSGRHNEACKYLRSLGHTWRLSRAVLNYSIPSSVETPDPPASPAGTGSGASKGEQIARCWDSVLSDGELKYLRSMFRPDSPYWSAHRYDLSSNSGREVGYISYQYPFTERKAVCYLEKVIEKLQKLVQNAFPAVAPVSSSAGECTTAEWWVHSRVHSSGHQLHYDSDETALGDGHTPCHPIASCVVYLDDNDNNDTSVCTGGPTVVTNQTLGGSLATTGYLCHPKVNRVCAFDGRYLHGVLPGKGPSRVPGSRRLTFMVGFWRTLRARPKTSPGAGQMLPAPDGSPFTSCRELHAEWRAALQSGTEDESEQEGNPATASRAIASVSPEPVDAVWEPVDAQTTSLRLGGVGLPKYNACFQGF
eukprot:GSChrysophyteH1.ASY1.ANO1.2211.1 assembled CDS